LEEPKNLTKLREKYLSDEEKYTVLIPAIFDKITEISGRGYTMKY